MVPSLFRIGQGYDVHAFGNGDHINLGGIKIPHDRGLIAHSDGDVLIHAICDALLGACALGDIGHHFPPSDEKWKNCASLTFLKHCDLLIKQEGFIINNLDTTIIAQQPKINPHIHAMQHNLAQALNIQKNQISIKATTTEKLGYIGQKKGIAAQSVCLLHKL